MIEQCPIWQRSWLKKSKVVQIFDLKFKIPLLTELSVEGNIIRYEEYSQIQKIEKNRILHYQQTWNYYNKLNFPLACEVYQSYIFNSVVVVYENVRILKYDVRSSTVFQSAEPANPTKTSKVNAIKLTEQEDSTPSCTSCMKPFIRHWRARVVRLAQSNHRLIRFADLAKTYANSEKEECRRSEHNEC